MTASRSRDPVVALSLDPLEGWALACRGVFHRVAAGVIESRGGPGLLWYARRPFADFTLRVEWRRSSASDNSGVFVRMPALDRDDWPPASSQGYEIQIDDRGVDHQPGAHDNPLHRTGAIYARSPATRLASRPTGDWTSSRSTSTAARSPSC